MEKIKNEIMLITYADSLGNNLQELEEVLETHFTNAIKGIHILPFYPSSGDRGFAVINYDHVEPRFGTWDDISRLSEKYTLAADFMVNHVSVRSHEFKDYMANADQSIYKEMFVHWDEFWPNKKPTKEESDILYSRKIDGPCKAFVRNDGKTVYLWNTFFDEQVDIDPYAKQTQAYFDRNLSLIANYVPLIRFDAFAYASKRPGTSCFFVEPDIWSVLDIAMKPLLKSNTQMLAEIHEHYTIQLKMADKGYWVYDFALPMLLLHSIYTARTDRLLHWLSICPKNQYTTLDTHDGIGLVDVIDLLTTEEIEYVQNIVDEVTKPAEKYSNFPSMIKMKGGKSRRYQLGCTYYSALKCDDAAYLLARAVQFFTPGIPQVYYVGLLAGENDIEQLKNTGEFRSINRHNYSVSEVERAICRPVVQKQLKLMQFRNNYKVFDGQCCSTASGSVITIKWTDKELFAELIVDFCNKTFAINYFDQTKKSVKKLLL